jgi:hypothetical protein
VVNAQVEYAVVEIVANETPLGMLTTTGTVLSVVVPVPICPELFLPQQYVVLVVVVAQLWYWPMSIAVNETPMGMVTAAGTALLVVVPLPSCPKLFNPQQYAVPVVVRAQVAWSPAEISANVTLLGMVTATGTLLLVSMPLPSWPLLFHPQQYAVPVVVRAQVEILPASIAENETPLGIVTATGTLLLVVVPLPKLP